MILIQSPITHELYKVYDNNIIFDKKMTDYGNYYNYNELIHLNDTLHFYDRDHLNQKGVVLFNRKVIEDLFIRGPN